MASNTKHVESLQLELLPLEQPAEPSDDTLEAQFVAFHQANPHVFRALYALAKAMHADGWHKAGMKALFERLRWVHAVRTKGGTYKLCNSYTAYYSRAIMAYDEELDGFFETRAQRDEYEPDLEELGLTRGGYDVGPKREQAEKARQVAEAAKSGDPEITITLNPDRAECGAGDFGSRGGRPGASSAAAAVATKTARAVSEHERRRLRRKLDSY